MTLAEKIAALRGERKLSQGDLAEKLDVSRQSVSKWETGQAVPELDKIIKLADLFGVSVDELVREAETPKPEAPPAAEPQPQIIYVERKGLPPLPKLGIVILVIGALMLFCGGLSPSIPVIGVALIILSLPLILAKKHPWLIDGWLLLLGSYMIFNPYITGYTPWGLLGAIRMLTLLPHYTPGARTYFFIGVSIGLGRGILFLVMAVYAARLCWKKWKSRKEPELEANA